MALHYATAKSRQQALLKWIWQSPRIPQCKRFLKMFLPPSSGSVILSLAHLRTLDRAFSSGGERFPDTEEVRSSNLLTPTKCSQPRGYVLWAVLFWLPNVSPHTSPYFEFFDLPACFSVVIRENSHLLHLHAHIFQGFVPRLHEARQGTTATCWSSIIFWILLA